MEKAEFIANAPIYYALAIYNLLRDNPAVSGSKIKSNYRIFGSGRTTLLDREEIWRRAVSWLIEKDSITILEAPFGSPLYERGPRFTELWQEVSGQRGHPFYMFAAMDDDDWLRQALTEVDAEYDRLGLDAFDFDDPDSDWTPIQLEETDPHVQAVTGQIDAVIEEVRKDNGYAATLPEERAYVLDGLNAVAAKFKARVISIAYLRLALDRLNILGRRFAGAALELTVTGAKQAVIEFIKAQGSELLQALRHLF